MTGEPVDSAPAFHRHVIIIPEENHVSAWVEDDYHHMLVALRHDGETIGAVEAEMIRAPWTTCPGAVAQLAKTFTGARLADAATQGEKQYNCTHLHDMAVLAAGHALRSHHTRYEIVVTDPVDGVRVAEIRRDDALALRIVERDDRIEEPAALAGRTLFELGRWIMSLDDDAQEAARLLRWAAIIAHGRTIPMERQSDASRMPPNCFTFQEGRKQQARRVGRVIDFTRSAERPLGHLRLR